jgi:glycosyltransferase involved in cell wall biosynthesis
VEALSAEVVVAADACADGTAAAVLLTPTSFRCTVVEVAGRGAAAARAAGAEVARGDVLLFLDDDMEPEPRAPGRAPARACRERPRRRGGRLAAAPPGSARLLPDGAARLVGGRPRAPRAARAPGHIPRPFDGNLSLPADLYARVGGFDPALRCREDHELGIRLLALRAEIRFAPGGGGLAPRRHHAGRLLPAARQEGRADVAIARRHPDLAAALPFAGPRTPPWVERLAFDRPHATDHVAAALRRALRPLERGRFRRRFRKLYGLLRGYWYWRGVAEEAGSLEAFEALLRLPAPREGRVVDLDLARGLKRAEELLDARRPAGARLQVGPWWVGYLPPIPGAEPLRGRHLRPALAGPLASPYLRALALAGAIRDADLGRTFPSAVLREVQHAR